MATTEEVKCCLHPVKCVVNCSYKKGWVLIILVKLMSLERGFFLIIIFRIGIFYAFFLVICIFVSNKYSLIYLLFHYPHLKTVVNQPSWKARHNEKDWSSLVWHMTASHSVYIYVNVYISSEGQQFCYPLLFVSYCILFMFKFKSV